MPWCPNCKMEYRNGITVCSDCNIELMEELPLEEKLVPFFQSEDKDVADKLVKYFDYSELKSTVQYDEENEIYVLSIPSEHQKKAKKLYQAFYFVERVKTEQEEAELSSDEENDMDELSPESEPTDDEIPSVDLDAEAPSEAYSDDESKSTSTTYIMKADQYKDLASTVLIFSLFGIGGLIFITLNLTGILDIYSGLLPNIILGALFVFFLYVGISTNKKAKKVQSEIAFEKKLTEDINQWLAENVTDKFISSLQNDDISEELNYIKATEAIKLLVLKKFGPQNLAYLDRIIEEFYSDTFDSN